MRVVLSGHWQGRSVEGWREPVAGGDRAAAQARQLETEHDRLQVEKRAQATPLRVEKLARERLQMRSATPAVTHYVARATTTGAAAAPATPAGVAP